MRIFLIVLLGILYSCTPHEVEPKIEQLTLSDKYLIVDSTGTEFWNRTLEPRDSITISFVASVENLYRIRLNNIDEYHQLVSGKHEFTYAIKDIELGDSILCSVGDMRFQDEIQYATIELELIYGAYVVDDPYYRYQWSLRSPDSAFGAEWNISPDAHISIEPAWKFSRGEGVKVAVLDFDLNPDHEDIRDKVIAGYTASTQKEWVAPDFSDNAHGTGVASVIAASGNNGTGMIGVAPESDLILIDIGNSTDAEKAQAFHFAKMAGAQVINCSWGTYEVTDPVRTAVQEMYDAGITVVFAAGNRGYDFDMGWIEDEAELPWAIGVGGSDESNDRWSRSAYGSNLDLIAPSGSFKPGVLRANTAGNYLKSQHDVVTEDYAFQTGCSFSAPHVTGVIALMLSVNPSLTPGEIREILIETTDKVGGSNAAYDENGFDTYRMYGKLNAVNAVKRAKTM